MSLTDIICASRAVTRPYTHSFSFRQVKLNSYSILASLISLSVS